MAGQDLGRKPSETGRRRPGKAARPQGGYRPEDFEKKVLEHCVRQGLFAPRNRVIAAVSGGADSMALLVFLLRQAPALGITVEAAHVDHGIRGAASAADAAFVAGYCAAHGVPLHRFSAIEAGIALPEHPSEDWARRLRYGFFEQLLAGSERHGDCPVCRQQSERQRACPLCQRAEEIESLCQRAEEIESLCQQAEGAAAGLPAADSGDGSFVVRFAADKKKPSPCRPLCSPAPGICIATAHTLNDQAETLLFRLARGCGLHGAGGIRPVRGGFVRPLLAVSRAEVEGYCAALSIPYVQDETNFQPLYARSRLRADALPALCSVNEGALSHLAGFCSRMQQLDAYFAAKGETLLQTAALRQGAALPPWNGLLAGPWALPVLKTALETDEPVLEAALIALMAQGLPGFSPEERIVRLAKGLIARGSGAVQLTADAALRARRGALWLQAARNVSGRNESKK